MQKYELNHYQTLYTKVKTNLRLNVRPKSTNTNRENIGKTVHDTDFNDVFNYSNLLAMKSKAKIIKLKCITLISFYTAS